MARRATRVQPDTVLQVRGLHVYYGQSHALQGVDLEVGQGVHAVVGRNGMGKTTLCNTIVGLQAASAGSVRLEGEELLGLAPYQVVSRGVAYTPQGRRLWASLSVDEHLALVDTGGRGWSRERIYSVFPRLYERRSNGGAQLSGGEQQMLAISRALLQAPRLLVMDEPTEGLAPVIVDQVQELLATLAAEGEVAILLIEQNIAVATGIAEDVAIMVNGRISQVMPAAVLAADRALQERLLGVGRHAHEDLELPEPADVEAEAAAALPSRVPVDTGRPEEPAPTGKESRQSDEASYVPPTRWTRANWRERSADAGTSSAGSADGPRPFDVKPTPLYREPARAQSTGVGHVVYVAGTFDTKGEELRYLRDIVAAEGVSVMTVDLSTSGKPSSADIPPHAVAAYRNGGPGDIFSGDRGASIRAMSEAFEQWATQARDLGGLLSAGGSGGTALATPAMRALPIGVPKVMISTVASGDVGGYVGPSDIMMMYSVTDVQGLNRISRRVLANGAQAIAGIVRNAASLHDEETWSDDKPGLGLTMFGVTTTAVQQVTALLDAHYDCLVFHATGTGGRSMEKLADSGLLEAAIDLTTTEVCDMMMGGVFAADEDRFGAFIRTRIPYVGSVGALDMVNFGPRASVPQRYLRQSTSQSAGRRFVEHNPQVTLMRTTPAENARMGEWIAGRLNQMRGPVRFLIPAGGVSALDAPGQPFHDPEADAALFTAIEQHFTPAPNRRIVRLAHHINDPAFAAAAVDALAELTPAGAARSTLGRRAS